MALFRDGAAFSGMAGLFAQNLDSTGTADGVDKFTNPNVAGKVDRVAIKVAPTLREITIGAGGVANIASYVPWFDPTDPLARYFINAWDNADPATYLQGYWHGHASEPKPFGVIESADPPLLEFDRNATEVRLKNTTGATHTYSLVVERIG